MSPAAPPATPASVATRRVGGRRRDLEDELAGEVKTNRPLTCRNVNVEAKASTINEARVDFDQS